MLPQLKRGNKISAVQKTLAFFGTRERNQMSNPVTPHSVKQWCGSLTVGHGAVLRPTGLMYSDPRKEASLPKEGHHSDALQPVTSGAGGSCTCPGSSDHCAPKCQALRKKTELEERRPAGATVASEKICSNSKPDMDGFCYCQEEKGSVASTVNRQDGHLALITEHAKNCKPRSRQV